MQPIRTVMTTLLATSLASLAYARPPALAPGHSDSAALQQDEPKPQQDEQKKKETPDNKAPKTEKQDKTANQQKAANSQQQKDQDQKPNRNVAKQDQKENSGQGAQHGRIADKDYQAHFGQQHTFSVRTVVTTTTIVPNQTRFVYTGYTFVFVDPWPVGWAMGDDCYIEYVDGGYFLFDVAHPGVQITLTIVA
jgi:flagellar motor protein MotB